MNTKTVTKLLECFLVQKRHHLSENPNSLSNAHSYFYKEDKKKLIKVRATDYLLWCQANQKPDNFPSLISWLEVSYDICQRAKNEFFKESPKASVSMTTFESIDSVKTGLVAESMEALALYENMLRSSKKKLRPAMANLQIPLCQRLWLRPLAKIAQFVTNLVINWSISKAFS
jgi:hypothetical protein